MKKVKKDEVRIPVYKCDCGNVSTWPKCSCGKEMKSEVIKMTKEEEKKVKEMLSRAERENYFL